MVPGERGGGTPPLSLQCSGLYYSSSNAVRDWVYYDRRVILPLMELNAYDHRNFGSILSLRCDCHATISDCQT